MYDITLEELGVRSGGYPLEYLETALRFFQDRMPGLSRADCVGYLKGMDLHAPPRLGVRRVWLPRGLELARFQLRGQAGIFYTKPGTSPYQLGIATSGRHFARYVVKTPCVVLRSRCADLGLQMAGGGIQFIVPDSSVLEPLGEKDESLPGPGPTAPLPDWF